MAADEDEIGKDDLESEREVRAAGDAADAVEEADDDETEDATEGKELAEEEHLDCDVSGRDVKGASDDSGEAVLSTAGATADDDAEDDGANDDGTDDAEDDVADADADKDCALPDKDGTVMLTTLPLGRWLLPSSARRELPRSNTPLLYRLSRLKRPRLPRPCVEAF